MTAAISKPMIEVSSINEKPMANIVRVSIPITLSQYLITLGGFLSTLLLSFLGTKVFAASMLISSTQLLLSTVPFAVLFCLSPMVSRFVGEKKDLFQVGIFFRSAMLLSTLIGLIIMLILWNIQPIMLALHQPADLVRVCSEYFRLFLWAIPLSALSRVGFQIALGLFKQKVVFLLSLLSLIFFTVFAYVLIFGKWGFPSMGIQGLAVAYILQSFLNFVVLFGYFFKDTSLSVYQLFNFKLFQNFGHLLLKIWKMGYPIALQMGNELFSFFITTIMVGWLGKTALMAKQITTQYLFLLVIPLFGIGQASATLVAKFRGEQKFDQLKQYGDISIYAGLIYSLILLVIFFLMSKPLIQLFVHDDNLPPDFYSLVSTLLIIVIGGQVFDSVRSVATGSLRGLGDTQYALYVSLFGIWVFGLPLAYLFGFILNWGLIGIAMAHNVFSVLGAGMLWFRWKKLSKAECQN